MPYEVEDARASMEFLIQGLKRQHEQLSSFMNTLTSFSKRAEVNNLRTKLSIEIHHRELIAAFDAASAQIIRPPTETEVDNLRQTLVALQKDLDGLANFQAVVGFIEGVMTENAERFAEILKTIRT
jgi:hypothetical protein